MEKYENNRAPSMGREEKEETKLGSLENSYGQIMKRVAPSENLIENVLLEQREYEYWEEDRRNDRVRRGLKFGTGILRTVVMAGIFCVCFVFSLQVVAGSVPQVYELLYTISPRTAQFFKPVNKVSERDGIRMEVVSAYVHDNVAEICITMEDLTGNRIDESLDIGERYSIHQPYSVTGGCRLLNFDEETGVATLMITVTQWEEQDIIGKKMTFSVREFSSGLESYPDVQVEVDWAKMDTEPQLVSRWLNGVGYGKNRSEVNTLTRDNLKVLPPKEGQPMTLVGENGEKIIVEGIELSGIAYEDGFLRIQTRSEKYSLYYNHAYLWLENEEGNHVDCLLNTYYNEEEQGNRTAYIEYIFDVAEEELEQYTLHADVWIYDTYEKGPWQVTFPLEQAE